MSKRYKPSALRRAAEDLKHEPGVAITNETASFANGAIALDFAARILYCSELSVIEIIDPFATKQESVDKIKNLINRLETKQVAQAASHS